MLVINSKRRLNFSLLVSLFGHLFLIFGIVFVFEISSNSNSEIQITLVDNENQITPDKTKILANAEHYGSKLNKSVMKQFTLVNSPIADDKLKKVLKKAQDFNNESHKSKSLNSSLNFENYTFNVTTSTTYDKFQVYKKFEYKQLENKPKIIPNNFDIDTEYVSSLDARINNRLQFLQQYNRIRRVNSFSALSTIEAKYIFDWTKKVETLGTINFPVILSGLYGSVTVLVKINSKGYLSKVLFLENQDNKKINTNPIMQKAVVKTLKMVHPFKKFSSEMKKDFDSLEIVRTWRFIPGNIYIY